MATNQSQASRGHTKRNGNPLAPQGAFMVMCDGECDQICGSDREAQREARDLKAMGMDGVRVVRFASWAEAEDYNDKLRGY